MFDPHSPHFNKINFRFLQEQQNQFGVGSLTAQSTFKSGWSKNEMLKSKDF
jgi:hypothetical protein